VHTCATWRHLRGANHTNRTRRSCTCNRRIISFITIRHRPSMRTMRTIRARALMHDHRMMHPDPATTLLIHQPAWVTRSQPRSRLNRHRRMKIYSW
jgi:hypothetical protein